MRRRAVGLAAFLCIALRVAGSAQEITGPSQMDLCDRESFAIVVRNGSVAQSACQITITQALPNDGFVYVPGSTTILVSETGETRSDDPVDGVWDLDALLGEPYALPPGESIAITFDLETTCTAVSGTIVVAVDYVDCSETGVPLRTTGSHSVEVLPGAVVVRKEPVIADAAVGDTVVWRIWVENTGLGAVKNVVITDALGAGLAFESASDGGTESGGTIVWDKASTPSLAEIPAGGSVFVELVARVTACEGLENRADVAWGCESGATCFDTGTVGGTATASIRLLAGVPILRFVAPAISIPYCADGTAVTIPIENVGSGSARAVALCAELDGLVISNVEGGASFDGSCFRIGAIDPGTTFLLTFDVAYAGDWCTAAPSGRPVYELSYEDACGIPFHARPQFGSVGGGAGPALSATKSGPVEVRLGETVDYEIVVAYGGPTACGDGETGSITVIDEIPDGFHIIDPGGGTILPSGEIEWTFDPRTDPELVTSVTIGIPDDCGLCFGAYENVLRATGTGCCGCVLEATARAPIVVECALLATGELTVAPSVIERCGAPASFRDESTYADDPALDGVSLDELTYEALAGEGLVYVPGSAEVTVDGVPVPSSVTDLTPLGGLSISIEDPGPARGRTVIYAYDLRATEETSIECGGTRSFFVWSRRTLGPEAPAGACAEFYETTPIGVEAPTMSVAISGVPVIQDECGTYDVTVTLTRTSSLAAPYDVRLVLSGLERFAVDRSAAVCSGVPMVDGTTCTAPSGDSDTAEWRFGDGFTAGETAMITVPVTVPCGASLLALSATARFDGLCLDDDVYNDLCSSSGSASAALSTSADVYPRVTPEVISAGENEVTWKVCVLNSGNGTAYGTWLDLRLGAGLEYASATIDTASGATERIGADHTGTPMNGASWAIAELAPGEKRTIQLTARLIDCAGLTVDASTAWGCGSDCQPPRTESSYVVVPLSNVVATSYSETPIPPCAIRTGTVTAKNAGVTTVYDLVAEATVPEGLLYVGNAHVRVDGGPWSAIPDPVGAPGPTLSWGADAVPALEALPPNRRIDIRFDVAADCAFSGGALSFRAAYRDPCGAEKGSNIGRFQIEAATPALDVSVRRITPAAGEPISCGERATWEIDVANRGATAIPIVSVEAVLDTGWVFVESSGDPVFGPTDGGADGGGGVTFEILDLPAGETATLRLTADSVIGGTDCESLDLYVDAYWGCGPADGLSSTFDAACITAIPATDSAVGTRSPPVAVTARLSPVAVEACGGETTLTLELTNSSLAAEAVGLDVTATLPPELVYRPGSTRVDCGAGFAAGPEPQISGGSLLWGDLSASGEGNDLCASIPAGGTIRLEFAVDVSCPFSTSGIDVGAYYFDCCGLTQRDVLGTATLAALTPALSVTMMPDAPILDCADPGNEVSWTIRVTNSGGGTADVVRIEAALGSALVRTAGGTQLNGDPQQWGWEFGPLASGASEERTVSARLLVPDDCSAGRRTATVRATWACGPLDGDPNTIGESDCESGIWVEDTARARVPNLAITGSDIAPRFVCAGDDVDGGTVDITVRNTGDAAVGRDFPIEITETTTGWTVASTYVLLGGTLPIPAGGSRTLTITGWPITCALCDSSFAVELDGDGSICECQETDNVANRSYTPTIPDLSLEDADLSIACAGDGSIRIQGTVTVRNDGCGDAVTATIPLRVTVLEGEGCDGAPLDGFDVRLADARIAPGATQAFVVDRIRAVDPCEACAVSIRIDVDPDDEICECSSDDPEVCFGPFYISLPDLIIAGVDPSPLLCSGDAIVGEVVVSVENAGCGPAGPFAVRIETDGCWTFSERAVESLSAGDRVEVRIPLESTWADCGDCDCELTAIVDPTGTVCECDGTNNTATTTYEMLLPDLLLAGGDLRLTCATTGTARFSGTVTVENAGCGTFLGDVPVHVALYPDPTCDGEPLGEWTEILPEVSLASGGSVTYELTERLVVVDPCAGESCTISAGVIVDPLDEICECDGANNRLCVSIPSGIPDAAVVAISANVPTACDSGTVSVTVGNIGCGILPAGVVVRLTGDGAGEAATVGALPAGASESVIVPLDGPLPCGERTILVTVDPDGALCECGRENNVDRIEFFIVDPQLTVDALAAECREDGGVRVSASLRNLGGEPATGVISWLFVDGVLVYEAEETIEPGHGLDRFFDTISLPCGVEHGLRWVLGEPEQICECDETDNEAIAIVICPCPALVTEKAIEAIDRRGVRVDPSGPIEPGDTVTYRLAVQNVGEGTAFAVDVDDRLPTGSSYVAGTTNAVWPTGGSTADPSGGAGPHLTWPLSATLGGGDELLLTFDLSVTSAVEPETLFVNRMFAIGTDGSGAGIPPDPGADVPADTDPDDASDVAVLAVVPGLAVDKSVAEIDRGGAAIGADSPVLPGDRVTYRFTVRNVGGGTAYGVEVSDELPVGLVFDGVPGEYQVDEPAAAGVVPTPIGGDSFSSGIAATIAPHGRLTVWYSAVVTADAPFGEEIENVARAIGRDGAGNPIPPENERIGDTFDDDPDDPAPNDTGRASVRVGAPALAVDKEILDILRAGGSIGTAGPAERGDVILFRFTIRNVGTDAAYRVGFVDRLPSGTEIDAGFGSGTYTVDAPPFGPAPLGLTAGMIGTVDIPLAATIAAGGRLVADLPVRVTDPGGQGTLLVNEATARGEDAVGRPIAPFDPTLGDTSDDDPDDPDPDDTGIAAVITAEPAMVTEKAIARLARRGAEVAPDAIEAGDVITYRLRIANVGEGTAYSVSVVDRLPAPLEYVAGTSIASWNGGSSSADPIGMPGPVLTWTIPAPLFGGTVLLLEFDARVAGGVDEGEVFVNRMETSGVDGGGVPIPVDAADRVPADSDPDDASEISISARAPALVTNKEIRDIVRAGRSIGASGPAERGDRITYVLTVENVGSGSAFSVFVSDRLPEPLVYVTGSARLEDPTGTREIDPVRDADVLRWTAQAALRPGERWTIEYEAAVDGLVDPRIGLTNTMWAEALDGSETRVPRDNAERVASDIDPDDSSSAFVPTAVPAFVTGKRVRSIARDGREALDDAVEPGDRVTFELRVTNVGSGDAYNVSIIDELPAPLSYVLGSAVVEGESGAAWTEPTGAIGPLVRWGPFPKLPAGESIRVHFLVEVGVDLLDGIVIANTVRVSGTDAVGAEVPADRSAEVPADTDPTDSARAFLVARSARVAGEGGIVAAPILRKGVERLGPGPCEWGIVDGSRIWFQTDIALFASVELSRWAAAEGARVDPETLLPTGRRSVAESAVHAARATVDSVEMGSGLGIGIDRGPRIAEMADRLGVTPATAWDRQRADLAAAAGSRPAGERWLLWEFAGGDPRFAGDEGSEVAWSAVDDRIVPSAAGIGLAAQAELAGRRLPSGRPEERYAALGAIAAMANRVDAIDGDLLRPQEEGGPRTARAAYRWIDGTGLQVVDPSIRLLDQAALLWGLSEFAVLVERIGEKDSRVLRIDEEREAAERLVHELMASIDACFVDRGKGVEPPDAVSWAVLLVGLERAIEAFGRDAGADSLAHLAADEIAHAPPRDAPLAEVFAHVRGLGVAARLLNDPALAGAAQRAFDRIDRERWDASLGLYVGTGTPPGCTTPLDLAMGIGAIEEIRRLGAPADVAEADGRATRWIRTLIDDAAMHLGKALALGEPWIARPGRRIVPMRVEDAPWGWAPVWVDRWCPSVPLDEDPCTGWVVGETPARFQTDLSMYAAFELQRNAPAAEDVADANLFTLLLHSGLGRPIASDGVTAERTIPIGAPYASGSPEWKDRSTGGWDPETFDPVHTGSAVGMMLLRAAQEWEQLRGLEAASPGERVLSEAIREAIQTLDSVLDAAQQASGILHVPHRFTVGPDGRVEILDLESHLFDQAALLWGLTAAARETLDPATARKAARLIESTADAILIGHRDPASNLCVDRASVMSGRWERGDDVRTLSLAFARVALEGIRPRADAAVVVASIDDALTGLLIGEDGEVPQGMSRRGGAFEPTGCRSGALSDQLAAIRALLVESDGGLAVAERIFDRIEAVGWFDGIGPTGEASWDGICYSPLDLGLIVGALGDLARRTDNRRAESIQMRIDWAIDRLLGDAGMQLSYDHRSPWIDPHAPVLDQRICAMPLVGTSRGDVADPGEWIRYRIEVANPTDQAWRDLLLEDRPPAFVDVVMASPTAEVIDGLLRWRIERLGPGEGRVWTILARIDDRALPGTELENCAILTYRGEDGTPGLTRRACAVTTVGPSIGEMTKRAEIVPALRYETAEAMYLSTVLMRPGGADGEGAAAGMDAALGHLAAILFDSSLGLSLADLRPSAEPGSGTVLPIGRALREADLVAVPASGGDPRYESPGSFRTVDAALTTDALGSMLAHEAAAIDALERIAKPESDALASILRSLIEVQVDWIGRYLLTLGDASREIPHALARSEATGEIEVLDPTGRRFDAAALLQGLAGAVSVTPASDPLHSKARALAASAGERLLRLSGVDDGTNTLPWSEIEPVIRALRAAGAALPESRGIWNDRIEEWIRSARASGPSADPWDEAARVLILLREEGGPSADAAAASAALLPRLAAATAAEFRDREGIGALRRAALAIDLLGALVDGPGDVEVWYHRNVPGQLLPVQAPPGYGIDRLTPGPSVVAPVFLAPKARPDSHEPEILRFEIELETGTRDATAGGALSDCALGLKLVPGSVWQVDPSGGRRPVAVLSSAPLRLSLAPFVGSARIEYWMVRAATDAEWTNTVTGWWWTRSGGIGRWPAVPSPADAKQ